MKRLFLALFFVCLAISGIAQENACVVRVKDGDTYVLKTDKGLITVRLMGVDAPELNQAFGLEAFYLVRDTLLGHYISFISHGCDRYGRVLAEIFLKESTPLCELLIKNGWAWHYINYDKSQKLEALQQKASNQRLGLWACGKEKVCPPWLYRQYNQRNRLLYCSGCCGVANTAKTANSKN